MRFTQNYSMEELRKLNLWTRTIHWKLVWKCLYSKGKRCIITLFLEVQALTALSLIFAVPSEPLPICVLDEVDAPLDDANVTDFVDC